MSEQSRKWMVIRDGVWIDTVYGLRSNAQIVANLRNALFFVQNPL